MPNKRILCFAPFSRLYELLQTGNVTPAGATGHLLELVTPAAAGELSTHMQDQSRCSNENVPRSNAPINTTSVSGPRSSSCATPARLLWRLNACRHSTAKILEIIACWRYTFAWTSVFVRIFFAPGTGQFAACRRQWKWCMHHDCFRTRSSSMPRKRSISVFEKTTTHTHTHMHTHVYHGWLNRRQHAIRIFRCFVKETCMQLL